MASNSRRRFLRMAATSAGAAGACLAFPEAIRRALAIPAASRTGTIEDVEHIVVFMQENRSFDHYFGHLRGVRGYNDRFPIDLPNGKPVWYQPSQSDPAKPVLPFRLNTQTTSAQCVGALDHSWHTTHAAIDAGRYDQWPANKTDMTMGYHLRADIPFHYALADAFTVCDAYFCSMPGPTHPNRSYLMTGTVDPTGRFGGPLLDNADYVDGNVPPKYELFTWTTYPERLDAAGISWQVYQQGLSGSDPVDGNYGTNILQNFARFIDAPPGSSLYRRAQTVRTVDDLKHDVLRNRLPQVSWLLPPAVYSEHPKYTPAYGAEYTSRILDALTVNPHVWAKTVLFIMYDENDGFFDHLVPPQPPTSRSQGLSTVTTDGEIHDVINPAGRGGHYTVDNLPYGLGPRVPMTIVSPWTRGGFVCSQVFDHTSVIRFIEKRFGVYEPNITPWRRAVCGDLTSAFDFHFAHASFPALPDTRNYKSIADNQCSTQPAPAAPATPAPVDTQEPGVRRARALPYELHVDTRVDAAGNRFVIDFANRGDAGAHFHVYSNNRVDGPWRYTVEAGKSLREAFGTATTNGVYTFTVYGPNGFVRQFGGTVPQAADAYPERAAPEVRAAYDVANGNLHLELTNQGPATAKLSVVDNAYGALTRHFTIPPQAAAEATWRLADSHQWYDLTVSDGSDGTFVRRLAGHVETGRPSFSDPAATSVAGAPTAD